eukprot:CAMPEP_0119499320 /NCGR_PEP_ID=MMETSP1344-20130328/21817_1 /TAXON_ID=236787 /ORGANISM="Florenciella parvula, Strain CCMP2471" /LENGTH=57 /DNA_ID=CAMNT_0007535299 /DNA_START=87 /DNA_END=257 /DNA_ORIENTATION=-
MADHAIKPWLCGQLRQLFGFDADEDAVPIADYVLSEFSPNDHRGLSAYLTELLGQSL